MIVFVIVVNAFFFHQTLKGFLALDDGYAICSSQMFGAQVENYYNEALQQKSELQFRYYLIVFIESGMPQRFI